MNKQKRHSRIINFLGVIVGIIFILVAFAPSPTNDSSSAVMLVIIGLVFVILSLTSLGETRLKKWYMIPFFPFASLLDHIAPKMGFWILLIYGLVACGAFVGLIIFAPDLVQDWLRRN